MANKTPSYARPTAASLNRNLAGQRTFNTAPEVNAPMPPSVSLDLSLMMTPAIRHDATLSKRKKKHPSSPASPAAVLGYGSSFNIYRLSTASSRLKACRPAPFRFLDLPAEIRNRVYDFLPELGRPVGRRGCRFLFDKRGTVLEEVPDPSYLLDHSHVGHLPLPSVLFVNAAIRSEVGSIYFSTMPELLLCFDISQLDRALAFLEWLGPANRRIFASHPHLTVKISRIHDITEQDQHKTCGSLSKTTPIMNASWSILESLGPNVLCRSPIANAANGGQLGGVDLQRKFFLEYCGFYSGCPPCWMTRILFGKFTKHRRGCRDEHLRAVLGPYFTISITQAIEALEKQDWPTVANVLSYKPLHIAK